MGTYTNASLDNHSAQYYLERAYPLNRRGRLSRQALGALRRSLPATPLVQQHLGGLLRLANEILTDLEHSHPRDHALAQIEFAQHTLFFKRAGATPPTEVSR